MFEGKPKGQRYVSLAVAKKLLKVTAETGDPGRYWLEEGMVPVYGIHAWDEPKVERIPIPGRCEQGHEETAKGWCGRCDRPTSRGGFKTRPVPGQVQRRLKGGNMPWNR